MTRPLPAHDSSPASASAWAWVALAAVLAVGALVMHFVPHRDAFSAVIDWQPTLAGREPWRLWSAVFVHYSDLHLIANLAGAIGVAAWGGVARVPARCVIAWFMAWPLVQWGLALQPELRHYGGLSGVLHAGVAVVAVHLVFAGMRTQRRIGAAVLVALVVKLLSESPWNGAISQPAGWDIAVAPGAHVSGVAAGVVVAALAELGHRVALAWGGARGVMDTHD